MLRGLHRPLQSAKAPHGTQRRLTQQPCHQPPGLVQLAVLDAEKNAPGSNLTTFGDAVWWAMTTITTVGYGDHYPVTVLGRCVAAGLMVGGVAVLGVVTASVASWMVQSVAEETAAEIDSAEEPIREELRRLSAQVEHLTTLLRAGAADLPAGTPKVSGVEPAATLK
ncbi:potassium channel family protein [Arthrobacter sp. H16F315]|uniref:potassium channel family protein n=1 Tax=Arthrobacter sp. H16F315 TaxID=2955314 RepID=UPI0031580610